MYHVQNVAFIWPSFIKDIIFMTRLYMRLGKKKKSITVGKKGDLSDSECDTVVGLSISDYADLLG